MFYIFIITLLVQTLIVAESMTLNVRTTLFTPADMAKKKWTKREVALLRARMYFQGIVPPLEVSRSHDYIESLIRYIDNSYAAVNQARFDRDVGAILKVAASDVFGGYLKMVALPLTRVAYYNGDVSTKDALALFEYYEHIKDQLNTTGKGWSNPLKHFAKPHKVRGIRSHVPKTKVKNPCKRLLYFNQLNVSMPMPSINWDTRTMFVPLRDTSIVDLKSPHIPSVVQEFHEIASNCERSIKPDSRVFQGSFENWVYQDVVPHLSDDDLYTAFKGILQLCGDGTFVPITSTPSGKEYKKALKTFKSMFQNMSMKKIVILIVVALELMCGLATIIYCIVKKKKICNLGKKPKGKHRAVYSGLSTRSTSSCESISSPKIMTSYYNSFLKKFRSRCSNSSLMDEHNTTGNANYIRSYENIKKQRAVDIMRFKNTNTEQISASECQTQVSSTIMFPQRSSTSTAKNTSNDTGETVVLSTVNPEDNTSRVIRKSKRFRSRQTVDSLTTDTYNLYPILANISTASNTSKTVKERKVDTNIFNKRFDINVMQLKHAKSVEFHSRNASKARSRTSVDFKIEQRSSTDKLDHLNEKLSRRRLPNNEAVQNRKGILKSDVERSKCIKTSRIPKKITVNSSESSSPRAKDRGEPANTRPRFISVTERSLEESPHRTISPATEQMQDASTLRNSTVESMLDAPTSPRTRMPTSEWALDDNTLHRSRIPSRERPLDLSTPLRTEIPTSERALDDNTLHRSRIPNQKRPLDASTHLRTKNPTSERALGEKTLHGSRIPSQDRPPHSTGVKTRIPTLEIVLDENTLHRSRIPTQERPLMLHRKRIPTSGQAPYKTRTLQMQPVQTKDRSAPLETMVTMVSTPERSLDDSALHSDRASNDKLNVTL